MKASNFQTIIYVMTNNSNTRTIDNATIKMTDMPPWSCHHSDPGSNRCRPLINQFDSLFDWFIHFAELIILSLSVHWLFDPDDLFVDRFDPVDCLIGCLIARGFKDARHRIRPTSLKRTDRKRKKQQTHKPTPCWLINQLGCDVIQNNLTKEDTAANRAL